MDVCCRLLILLQPAPAHPRAYLITPAFPKHYSLVHPHPRYDQMISWNGKSIPGLCIYSAPEFQYVSGREYLAQFLDQVTTRQLFRGFPPTGTLLRILLPGEQPDDDKPVLIRGEIGDQKPVLDYWAGYWPGPISRAPNAVTHLGTLAPDRECWCGSGIPYASCHRAQEYADVYAHGSASRTSSPAPE